MVHYYHYYYYYRIDRTLIMEPKDIEAAIKLYDTLPYEAVKNLYIHMMHLFKAVHPENHGFQELFMDSVAFEPTEAVVREFLIEIVVAMDMLMAGESGEGLPYSIGEHPKGQAYIEAWEAKMAKYKR